MLWLVTRPLRLPRQTCSRSIGHHFRQFDHLIGESDPIVAQHALRAAGRAKRLHPQDFARACTHADASVRAAAFQAAAHAGLAELGDACRAAATRGDIVGLAFLGTLGDPADMRLIERAVRQPTLAPVAVSTIGAMGRVQSVPLLLELMADKQLEFGRRGLQAYHGRQQRRRREAVSAPASRGGRG